MILITIDTKSRHPLFEQIVDQIRSLIESGGLKEGEVLPSTRKLAENVGVNRATVYRAYEELWAAGYIEAVAGGYSRVRKRIDPVKQQAEIVVDRFGWEGHLSDAFMSISQTRLFSSAQLDGLIDFRSLSPDSDLLPVEDFRRSMNAVIQTEGASVLQYGDPAGYLPLRELLARQMKQHGIHTSADEIVLTNGMQNGIELVCRLLTNPGDCVFVESPTYASALTMMNYLGLKVQGISMTSASMNLDELEASLRKQKPKLIYSMPTFHNPTGISTSQSHRERLLRICERYGVPLVEDGFEEEMKYFGKAVLPVKSMDRKQQLIYLGTFSKILFPGLRIGWIVAPVTLAEKLRRMKEVTDLSGSPLTQAAVFRFCDQGFYELHKKRIHRAYRKRMQLALAACREFLPQQQVQFTRPEGGYLIWLTTCFPLEREAELNQKLIGTGVAVSPGSRFFAADPEKAHFRLSIAHRKEDEIVEGIKRIAEVIQNFN
ncbi:MocR-like pyridoxine biosynthesis transcription factor PdxR [Mangrovibacterium diazotrophicum]|uniref:GntR family transcriptional regulator n=1 Tax=Mangrovibacterium diazotrophicum TaxID=1261403 RepID=A0A419W710_9BACT|nr:PLP-dependent aminotransferase family protein [Mangrovibacterium diazotrophicum]RKD91248.1 GntR family transcriptional regulator [Mangrovibacterium diazotrophicum]